MDHILIIMQIIVIFLGVAAFTTVLRSYQHYQLKQIKRFSFYILGVTLYIFVRFIYFYMKENLGEYWLEVHRIAELLVPLVIAGAIFFLMMFVTEILGSATSKFIRIAYCSVFGIISISRIVKTGFPGSEIVILNQISSGPLMAFSYFLSQASLMILLLKAGFQKSDPKQKQTLIYFAGIFLFTITMWYTSSVLSEFNLINQLVFEISFYFQMSIIFGSVIRFADGFTKNYLLRLEPKIEDQSSYNEAILQYSITKREKDVIELICQGKSNKEIADLLFISIPSVKGHVTNIYRKTAVGNRVSLTNLFTKSKSTESLSAGPK